MSDMAAYHVFVCALFPVQGGVCVLPVDDMRCAILTWGSSESVLM